MDKHAKSEFPKQRPRIHTTQYKTASQIKTALGTDNPDTLTQVLTSIRNQLTLKSHEVSIPPHDGRLTIVKEWMELSSGAEDLFEIWNNSHPRQSSTLALVLSNLSAILTLLSAHYTEHVLGRLIMKALLTPARLRYMNSYIGGSHNELIIATLKLYHIMSNFASGRDKKSVLEGFGWEIKSLPNLLNMRRRVRGAQDRFDPLLRPDIRTLFILFLLSFLDINAASQTKNTLLEQHRDTFLAVFKGIAQDHYSLARKVLESCWAGIWSDNKLSRTLKVGLFNETTIGHLTKLYERVESDNDDDQHIPADLVHHFLLAICTRPGTGICFKDRGWYPRETEDDAVTRGDEDPKKRPGRLHNKILSNVLKTLRVNEGTRQQELAMRILAACPELVAGYWSAGLTLEPRLSTKWINSIAFFGNIISLPPPMPSFYLSNQLFNPTPPALSTVLENILPMANNKNNLSKGLQSSSGLVQHCTAIALTKCLLKFDEVLDQFRKIAKALEEEEDGQWWTRCKEIEREVRRRVPDFMVVVAFGHQTQQAQNAQTIVTQQQSSPIRSALLGESAQRLLWLYQRCLPAVVAEARFDVGKLLQSFNATSSKIEEEKEPDAAERICRVHLLHIIRLLKDSDQFAWASKIATMSHTPFFILLSAYISSMTQAIRTALGNLICHVLSQSVLFQEDPHEPDLWLKALPAYRLTLPPDLQIQELDTIDLRDENAGVIVFLDECVQRCLRTLYRYVEAQRSLASSHSSGFDHLDEYPSPLIMTLFEQLAAKTNNKSLCPTHVIGITAFLGRLILYLTSKTKDLFLLRAYAEKLDSVLSSNRISEEVRVVIAAAREVKILRKNLSFIIRSQTDLMDGSAETGLWISRLEKQSISGTKISSKALALCIVDKLRTLQEPLTTDQLKRLIILINTLHISTLPNLIEHLVPGQADLWSSIQVDSRYLPYLTFERLYIHAAQHDLVDIDKQAILAETVFTAKTSLLELKRVIYFVMHGIQASKENPALVKAHILILTQIFGLSKAILNDSSFEVLKELVFVHPNYLKDMFLLPLSADILDAVDRFLMRCISHLSTSDRKLLSDISNHWFNLVQLELQQAVHNTVITACIWVKYLEPTRLLDLFYFLLEPDGDLKEIPTQLLQVILKALSTYASSTEWQNELSFTRHIPRLLSLCSVLPNSLLGQVIASAAECSIPMGLDGLPVTSSTGNLATLVSRSRFRWAENLRSVKTDVDIRQFLQRERLSDSTSRLVQGLLYQRPSVFSTVVQWIKSEEYLRTDIPDIQHILLVVHGLIDVSGLQGQGVLEIDDIWMSFLPQIASIVANEIAPTRLRLLSQQCLHDLILASGVRKSEVLDVLAKEVRTTMKRAPTRELINLAVWLGKLLGSAADEFLSPIVDGGMQWSITQISDGNRELDFESYLQSLGSLVKVAFLSKAQLVETLVSVIIQHRSSSSPALQLATACVGRCQLRPVVINRLLQNIIQHPHFARHGSIQSMDGGPRDALIELLHVLFNLHPNNTCQITHIEPLIRIYRGTLSISDLRVLSNFQLFESQRKLSVSPLLSLWSASSDTTSTSALEALQSLDPGIVFRTCLNFPRWRRVEGQASADSHIQDSRLYDPVFLLLLFGHMIGEHTPSSNFAWVDLLRTNVVSLFLRALSAKDQQIRELALCQVVSLWRKLENADFQEKLHVQHILNLVRYLIPAPSSPPEAVRRLPTYATLLLSHALRTVFYPTNFLYPLTARFLLQRPTLDISDVPMLYGMLYSSSDDNWKKERAWMIKFLADGMVGSDDWRVLKRRHTWDLLASLFQSEGQTGTTIRSGILEVLANLTCNVQATTSLILKSGLLTWIEMQLINSTLTHNTNLNMESVQWIKILDNILVIVKPDKIEAATNGEWRKVISRCLCHLLDDKFVTVIENLSHTVPVILRLVSLKGTRSLDLTHLFELAINTLEKLEAQIQLPANFPESFDKVPIAFDFPLPPHRSATLQQRIVVGSLEAEQKLSLWGNLVEILWHSSILLDGMNMTDVLVPRILIWRSLKGGLNDKTDISEWTRQEVVRNLYRDFEEHQAL